MDVDQKKENGDEVGHWFSTYGLITAQRILGYYRIELPQDMIAAAVKIPASFYHRILQVPLRNVLNGIVLQQAYDYNVYAQKIFIDYLLSPECASPDTAPGANIRGTLEEERKRLVDLGEQFHNLEIEHANVIADSQKVLFQISDKWHKAMDEAMKKLGGILKPLGKELKPSEIKKSINHALSFSKFHEEGSQVVHYLFIEKMNELLQLVTIKDVKTEMEDSLKPLVAISLEFDEQLSDYYEKIKEMHQRAVTYRKQFYETILRTLEQIQLLPEYKIDPVQDQINRETLLFDKSIGEDS